MTASWLWRAYFDYVEVSELRHHCVFEVLDLNRLPAMYGLNLIFEAPGVTDMSIVVLVSLRIVVNWLAVQFDQGREPMVCASMAW